MKNIFPNYDITDLHWAEKEGYSHSVDFDNLLSELIENEILNHDTEICVAKYILSKGTNNLSESQANVADIIIKKYTKKTCNRCSSGIALP